MLLGAVLAVRAEPLAENFESFAEETKLQAGPGPGWIFPGQEGVEPPSIREAAGGAGKVLVLPAANVFAEYRNWEAPLWRENDGSVDFSVDFCLTGKMSELNVVISQYGSAGFAIGIAPDAVSVSSGGDTAFKAVMRAYAAKVEFGTWYTLRIRDINLSKKGPAESITGKLYVYERDKPSSILLDGVTIKAAGTERSFSAINQITFRRFGGEANAVEVELDNVALSQAEQ